MRALRTRALAAALALAIAVPAHAQEGDAALLLDLCINGRCVGVAAVIERGDQVLVDREALLAAGIDLSARALTTERIGEREFVPLRELAGDSAHVIDHAQLRLDVTLRAGLLPGQRRDLRQRPRIESPPPHPWSAFVNYAATLGERDDRGLFLDGAFGRGHAALRSNGQWDAGSGWRRGLTRIEVDQPDRLRRWTAGDQFAVAQDALGGGVLLGGFGVERAFDQDPYLVTFPQPFYTGVMESPGTVEIYSNGVLIGRRELGAGPFTLEHLGVQPGRSDVQVLVRDPFGNRSQLATASYYGSSQRMLAPGLDEYALRIGRPRDSGGLGGGYRDEIAMQGWYRRGVSDTFTVGGRIEGDRDLRNLGLDGVISLPLGEVSVAVAWSHSGEVGGGRAVAAGWNYAARTWSLSLGSRRANEGYRNIGDPLAPIAGPLRADDYANVGLSPWGRVSLQINAGRQQRAGQAAVRTAGLSSTWRMWPRTQALFGVQRREDGLGHETIATLSVQVALDRHSLGVSARHREDAAGDTRRGYGLDARRSRPVGTGWGYDLSVQTDEGSDTAFGQVEYQSTVGRYALQADRLGGEERARLVASGALVALGGRAFATPPLDGGFALVRVRGMTGLPILRENLEVGRTDAQGDLLMRDLLPFHANRIALDEDAVPPGHALHRPKRTVQVPRNTGALVELEAAPVRAVTGRLLRHTAGGTVAAGARATYERAGERFEVPLGQQGRFYFEDLAAGTHEVEVDGEGGPLRCGLTVPASTGPGIARLGDILCAPAGGGAMP